MLNKIRIGSRGSELALKQSKYISDLIGADKTEIVVIKTKGDKIQNVSFDKMEGKGFFTKEIEDALLARRIDVAVHSMKDIPTESTPGLMIAAVTKREDPSDVLLIRNSRYKDGDLLPLHNGSIVGTSSLRRSAQIKNMMNSLRVHPLRGNITTRINKLRNGRFDAIIIARAGLNRLHIDISDLVEYTLPFSFFLPAPAQGALAVQMRTEDNDLLEQMSALNHKETAIAVEAERCFLKQFGGGCHVPLGAFAFINREGIHLSGVVASVDGNRLIRSTAVGSYPEVVGKDLAELLKKEGADEII